MDGYAGLASRVELFAADAARDRAFCGCSLDPAASSRFAHAGAHDPTPTPYFVLEELFGRLGLDEGSHLLDVGCGAGRTLAYIAQAGLPGRATGVELDAGLARQAGRWTRRFDRLEVVAGNVLDLPLARYTHFYLFNPFDTAILVRFLDKLEAEAVRPVTLLHMSDNGEEYAYWGRGRWSVLGSGSIQDIRTSEGKTIRVYDHPQHFTLRRLA